MRHATAAVVKRHEHSFSATGAVPAAGSRPSALLRSRRGAYCFGAGVWDLVLEIAWTSAIILRVSSSSCGLTLR